MAALMSKKLLLAFFIIAIAGSLTWGAWRSGWIETYIVAPLHTPLTVQISPQPASVTYEQHIKLTGSTSIPSHIKVQQNSNTVAETNTEDTFSFDINLRPGTNDLVVTATTTIGWHDLEATGRALINYESLKPSAPILMPYAAQVNSPQIHLKGEADPEIEVNIIAEKLTPASGQNSPSQPQGNSTQPALRSVATTWADADGTFKADLQLADEGTYRITALALNNQKKESYSSNALELNYDKNFYPKLQRTTRSTEISIGYREVKTNLEVKLPNDDPLVTGLITGKVSNPEFISNVFGYLVINEQSILGDIGTNSSPTYEIGNTVTTVKFSALENGSNLVLPSYSGTLKIERLLGRTTAADNLKLTIKDYELRSIAPLPSTLSGNEATWVGDEAAQANRAGVSIELSSAPSADPLRVLQLTPRAVLSRRTALILDVVRNALSTIPFIWFFWLLRRKNGAEPVIETHPFETTTARLMTVTLIPVVLHAATSNWSVFLPLLFRRLTDTEVPFYLDGLILTVIAFALILVIARWLRPPFARCAFTILGKTLLKAWLAVSLMFVFLFVIYRFGVSGYVVLTMIVAAPVLTWFLAKFFRWTRLMLAPPATTDIVKLRKREWFLLIIVAAIFTYPADNILFHIYSVHTWQKVMFPLQQLFSELSNLAPYALILVIFTFLRRLENNHPSGTISPTEKNYSLGFSVSALLFSSYLVGVDPSWFWVPIPFLLSLYLFPRLVLLSQEKQTAVSGLVTEIRAQRGSSIRAMKDRANARQMQEALAKLEKKFNAGDLSLTDYENRSKQIEDYLQQDQASWSPRTSLKTKDVVLSVSPFGSNWENAWWAAKKSLYLMAPLLLIYVLVFLLKDIQSFYSYFYLWFAVRVASFMLDGIVGALFFGFFFNSIRGSSGLKKGMNISFAIILCLLPSWIAPLSASSVTNLIALVFRAGQTFLFFTILGVWAFDYKTYRDALGEQFEWKKFAKFGDMPGATTFVSITLTSLGVALTTVLTGQFTSIVTQIIKVALPAIPVPTPGK
jgi:hypothetical protein